MKSDQNKSAKHPVPEKPEPPGTENEDADPVGEIPGAMEFEEAAEDTKRLTAAKSARSADSIQQEAEVTEQAMPTPKGVKHPNF